MDKRIYTTLMMMMAGLQVACGGDSKDEKMAKFMAQCQQQQACIDMYRNAANNAQIQGLAAQAGLPQIAATGSSPQGGQVASTAIVPASITDAQLKAAAAKVQSQLSTLNSQQAATSAPVATASPTANYTPASAVEIGVTRLNSTEVLPASTPMRNPSSLTPASAQNPVAQQEESSGGAAAGQ